ncbi:hypothetical protein OIDMADRAFT_183895 [Oidiodendron maius Zn]|uniref:Ubiquitin-like domain-containing protein n=1 Tax=Oidiodendron maius (strain Zn) TaxID=913774 RepID=A0A0C3C8U5_OIDMZ|nr:hypothetical protein OIDMADRAFT_183895 [Oidiodendron maius Zn]
MAGIGEAAAIAGLISLGLEVARAIYSVADGIGAAGNELRNVAQEVESYTRSMEAIQEVLNRQNDVDAKIMAVIDRLVDICLPILKTYREMQTSLAPLLERFRNSKKKLKQFGSRIEWYIRSKKKVYICRDALQRQFYLLTPVLAALGIGKINTTQNILITQNIIFKVTLEDSATRLETLHRNTNTLRLLHSTEQTHQSLLPPAEDSAEVTEISGETQSVEESVEDSNDAAPSVTPPASTAAASQTQSAIIVYQQPGDDKETLSPKEAEEIDRLVDETLDEDLERVSDRDLEGVVIDTIAIERQFLQLIQQILASLGAGASDIRPTRTRSPTPRPKSPISQAQDTNTQPASAAPSLKEDVVFIEDPSGIKYKFPYNEVKELSGLTYVLEEMNLTGFDFHELLEDSYLMRLKRNTNVRGQYEVETILRQLNAVLLDSDGVVIMPRVWDRFIRPGMGVQIRIKDPLKSQGQDKSQEQEKRQRQEQRPGQEKGLRKWFFARK